MEAAVLSAEGEAPPPAPLQLAWWCNKWGTLPEAGGLHDQSYRTVIEMVTLENIYNVVTRVRNMQGEQIHQLTSQERRVLASLREMGLI